MKATRPMFKDRASAARKLALCLSPYREQRPLVVGLPPGGTVMAQVVAADLGGDVDVALLLPLRSPGEPPVVLGAVSENGTLFLEDGWGAIASRSSVESGQEEALAALRDLRGQYTPGSARKNPASRLVILVDDGTSPALLLRTAVLSFRDAGARLIVASSAVASVGTEEALRQEADVVICLRHLDSFSDASEYFKEFGAPTMEELRRILREPSRSRPLRESSG